MVAVRRPAGVLAGAAVLGGLLWALIADPDERSAQLSPPSLSVTGSDASADETAPGSHRLVLDQEGGRSSTEPAVPPAGHGTSEGPASALQFLVLGESGAPVEGVELFASSRTSESGAVESLLGRTPASGELVAAPPFQEACTVSARSPGHVRTSVSLAYPFPPQTEIHLRRGGVIHGRVQDLYGNPVTEDAWVLVWPVGYRPGSTQLVSALADPPAGPTSGLDVSAVDPTGRFRIAGLDPGGGYTLVAGGGGRATREPLRGLRPDGEPLLVTLASVSLARLDLRDVNGGPLRTSPDLWGLPEVSWTWRRGTEDLLGSADVRSVLAGLGTEVYAGDEPHLWSLAFVTSFPEGVVGPIQFRATVPGYSAAEREIFATPMARGGNHVAVLLESRAVEWGALTVELTGAPQPGPRSGRVTPWAARLLLTSMSDGSRSFLPIHDLGARTLRFEGIPCDDYELQLETASGFFAHPGPDGEPVRVSIRGPAAAVEIDLSELGSVALRVADESGSEYGGEVVVALTSEADGSSCFLQLAGPPYVVQALPEGSYRVALYSPYAAEPACGRDAIAVQRGERDYLRFAPP